MDGGGHEQGLRSGTLNVPSIVGFAEAVRLATEQCEDESKRIGALRDKLEGILLPVEGARRNGHPVHRLYNNVNITFPFVHADDLMTALKDDVAVSSGSACSSADTDGEKVSHVLKALGLDDELGRCTIRLGLSRFSTEEEIDYAGRKIAETVVRLRNASPQYHMMKKNDPSSITALTH